MKPFFSIVVACCNVGPYLRKCLGSVAGQGFSDWECLLGVEDSTDDTDEIAGEYAIRDARFRVFAGPRSGSPSRPRNVGLDHASGDYVIFVDGDDFIREGSLERLHDRISSRPGADLYPCAIEVSEEESGLASSRDNYPDWAPAEMNGAEATALLTRLWNNPWPMAQMTIYRRAFLDGHGLRFVDGLRQEDFEFLPRSLFHARRVVPLHEAFYVYVKRRSGSISTAPSTDTARPENFAKVFRSLLGFHARISTTPGFDGTFSRAWADAWLGKIFLLWFGTFRRNLRWKVRLETLRRAVAFDGGRAYGLLARHASPLKRLAARFAMLAARHPAAAPLADAFFLAYFPFLSLKKRLHGLFRARGPFA